MLSNYMASLIRTGVPIAVGFLLTWLSSTLHFVINPGSEPGLVALAVFLVSSAYYALVRLLEKKWPKLGALLGYPEKPVYTS